MNITFFIRSVKRFYFRSINDLTKPNLELQKLLYRQLSILDKYIETEELHLNRPYVPNTRNFHNNIKEKNELSETPLLSIVKEICVLQNARATSLVIENKLRSLLFYYKNISKEEKEDFLMELAGKYSVNHDEIVATSKQLTELESNGGGLLKMEEKLRGQLTPQYVWLFRYLGRLEHGIKFLVGLRRDVLGVLGDYCRAASDFTIARSVMLGCHGS